MQSSLANIFVLDLIVSERVIQYFRSHSQQSLALERGDRAWKTADTVLIASHVYGIPKTETLLTVENLELVKKKTKRVELLSNSIGFMTPRDPHP